MNAIVGDNGILTQAQNANVQNGMAVLEEYLQEFYVEHYDEFSKAENKAVALKNYSASSGWFYQGAPLGYVVDSDGNSHYFINKDGLPDDIKKSLVGGNAGDKTYADYAGLNDVYGVTSNLRIYYCSNGKNSIIGLHTNELDVADSTKEIFASGSSMAQLITGKNDSPASLEDCKSVKQLTIDNTSGITNLSDLYGLVSLQELTLNNVNLSNLNGIENATQLNYIYFKGCNIADYTGLGRLGNRLKYLYLYNIDNTELEKLCSKTVGIGSYDLSGIEYFGVFGNTAYVCSSDINVSSSKSSKTITTISYFDNLSITTKNAVKYLSLQNNNIADIEDEYNIKYLKDFKNLKILRIEYNSIRTLKGLENLNNLTYLIASNNNLGLNLDGEIKNTNIDALSSLSALAKISRININYNSNIKWIDYLPTTVSGLYFLGDENIVDTSVANIRNIIKKCGTSVQYPTKYWLSVLDSSTTYLDVNGQTLTQGQLETIGTYTGLKILNLKSITITDNIENIDNIVNSTLSQLKNLEKVSLRGLSEVSTIKFVKNTDKLMELNLLGTKVSTKSKDESGNYNGLELLNSYCPNLKILMFSSDTVNLGDINTAMQKVFSTSDSASLIGNGEYVNFYTDSETVVKTLGNLRNIPVMQFTKIVQNNVEVDLSNVTGLTHFEVWYGTRLKSLKLPPTCSYIKSSHIEYIDLSNIIVDIDLSCYAESTSNTINILKTVPSNITLKSLQTDLYNMSSGYTYLYVFEVLHNIYSKDLRINSINIASGGSDNPKLTSLHGIEYIIGLQSLTISSDYGKNLKDISSLSVFSDSMKSIDLSNKSVSLLYILNNFVKLEYLNLSNNCIYDTSTYIDSNGEKITVNNLEIFADLNKNGALKSLYLNGNNGITNWTSISNLTWTGKSGF